MINGQTSDKRIMLNAQSFNFLKAGTVELTMPFIANANYAEVNTSVTHNYGQIPNVLAFVTFPSVQAPGEDYTRIFGTSVVQTGTVGASDITIVFTSEEEVISSLTDITFNWKVSNATGFAQPEITVSIDYYIQQQAAPPAVS